MTYREKCDERTERMHQKPAIRSRYSIMKIKKTYEVSDDGRITIYPPLYENKEGNKFRLFLIELL